MNTNRCDESARMVNLTNPNPNESKNILEMASIRLTKHQTYLYVTTKMNFPRIRNNNIEEASFDRRLLRDKGNFTTNGSNLE